MDNMKLLCTAPAQDLFCDLQVYKDEENIEVRLLLFKKFVIKKWTIPRNGIGFAWCGHDPSGAGDYGIASYIGFILLNGKLLKIPVMQISTDIHFDDPRNFLTKQFYRTIIEEVIETKSIGIDGISDYGIEVRQPKFPSMYISETKGYRKRLSEMYKEKQDGHRTPDDIFSLMKAENIQGKILDWLQNDGFLYSRKYTWDKVYKKD
ncbi:MAG: hypothetical protein E7272_04345 [Pseudobutyrivibrio ruminis]|uniref:Uncharacterized protein n=1 Tax=Pseudobutyrivibrio ruminis TaxID=46206 RepID=A0A927U6Q2_9FIRM|nr:hypothetical protein [Pseudobutyrivibrio ruminis]